MRHLRVDSLDPHHHRDPINTVGRLSFSQWTRHPRFCYSSASRPDERRNYSIMRTPSFLSDHLREFLRSRKIATLPELKLALGTTVDEIPQFDPQGLWSFQEVWFSRWGNLVTTLEALVGAAPQGYFANELQQILHVEVKDALLQLIEQRRVARQSVNGLFLYCSPDAPVRRRQLLARQALSEIPGSASAEVSPEELKASLVLFSSLLDERQRRLYAGLESLKLGRGGESAIGRVAATGSRHRSA